MQSKVFIANWKMQKTVSESIDFCRSNLDGLKNLSSSTGAELVLCPTFPALLSVHELLKKSPIGLGGQTASPSISGAFTGQVSAQSLKEVGCTYCIVGHSEQRKYAGVTDQEVAQAAKNLCNQNIEPIICIGETKEQFHDNDAIAVLEQQLDPVMGVLKNTMQAITIAYEPVRAIGTGTVPDSVYLEKIFKHLKNLFETTHSGPWRLIYGGSVSEETIIALKNIPALSGFLIGSASLDFQKFEKIVLLGK